MSDLTRRAARHVDTGARGRAICPGWGGDVNESGFVRPPLSGNQGEGARLGIQVRLGENAKERDNWCDIELRVTTKRIMSRSDMHDDSPNPYPRQRFRINASNAVGAVPF
jgi:hypothetical protein